MHNIWFTYTQSYKLNGNNPYFIVAGSNVEWCDWTTLNEQVINLRWFDSNLLHHWRTWQFSFTNYKMKEILLIAKNDTKYPKIFYFNLYYKIVDFVLCHFYFYHWYVVKNYVRFLHQLHSFNQSIQLSCSAKKTSNKNIFFLKLYLFANFLSLVLSFAIKAIIFFIWVRG